MIYYSEQLFSKRIFAHDYVQSGVPFYASKDVIDKAYGLFKEPSAYIAKERFAEVSRKYGSPRKGDLLLSSVGNRAGIAYVVQDEGEFYFKDGNITWFRDFKSLDSDFLCYWLRSSVGQDALASIMIGSAQKALTISGLQKLKITVPQRPQQKQIAYILKSLDERIALLRETNATLEAIAQALFKSWFVDFDPVHARARGKRPPGLAPEVAALFPDSFEESDLGKIPKGWTIGRVEDLMELAYGKALKATARIDGPIPVYGSGGITGYHNESLVNGPSIIVGRKGTVGSLYWEDLPFFPIDTVFYVKTQKPQTYCFYLLQRLGLKDMNTDAAVPGLNRNNVYRLQVLIPPEEVLAAFDNIASVLRHRIFSNNQQSQTLANLRDTLLPRLISGQLRLPDAEAMVSEAQA